MKVGLRAPTTFAPTSGTGSPTPPVSSSAPASSTPTSTEIPSTDTSTSSPPPTFSSQPTTSNTPITFTTSTTTQTSAFPEPISTIQPSSSSILPTTSTSTPVSAFSIPPQTYPSTFGKSPETSTSTSTITTSSAQASASGSSNGFFSHTGTVVGTFTAVGVVVVALLVALFICACRRRRSDDDDRFLEKIVAHNSNHGGDGTRGLASLFPIPPTATNAFPNHHAHPTNARSSIYNPEEYYFPRGINVAQQPQNASTSFRAPRPMRPISYVNPYSSPNPRRTSAHVPMNPHASSAASRDSFYRARDRFPPQ